MNRLYQKCIGCVIAALILFTTDAWAQTRTVTGTVKSAEENVGMPGVNVIEKGTNNGSVTDSDGNFSISVGTDATLIFSFVGYATQEVSVEGQSRIDLVLTADVKSLAEVVVVGYGTVQKKDLTGSVSQVSSKDFNGGITPNPLQAIQGKVAGLTITQPNGDPNQAPTVRLRGYTSLAGGSDPLYVVDGVIGVPINSISPSDIESMDVLKDASAAAIYGSRGANGVIMITTKRGREGKTVLEFNNYVATESFSRKLDLLDANGYRTQVARIKGEASLDDNIKFPTDASGRGYDTDWLEQITQRGYTNNHDLALSGGTNALSYRGSINYINRMGLVKNTGFERVTGRINLDQKAINNKLNVQYNLSLTSTTGQLANNDIINRAVLFLPTLPVRDADGEYYEVRGSFDLRNPVAMLENYRNDEDRRVLIGGVNMRYELFKGFTVGANGAYRYENRIQSEAYNGSIYAYESNQGSTSRRLDQSNDKLLELTAQYKHNFANRSDFTVLGGYSFQEVNNDGFSASNNTYIKGLYELLGYNHLSSGRGTLLFPRRDYTSSYNNSTRLISFFGRAGVNLNDRYNFTATLRRDGSSKFGANNKWGTFPSVAAGWTISNESFLSGNNTLNYLKLRAGWGQTGNAEGIDPYNSLQLYGPSNNTYYDPVLKDFVPGYEGQQNENRFLKWEVLSQVNIGLDFELLDGKINGTVEVYDKRTKDMLYNYPVPFDGVRYVVSSLLANVGEMSNKGIELSLGADVVTTDAFRWNTRIVGAAFKNEVVSISNEEFDPGIIQYNPFEGRGMGLIRASQLREGHPMGEFYIPKFVGFNEDGRILMVAKEGDDPTTDMANARLFESGTAIPTKTVSWINNFTYRNLDLSFQLRGVFGNKIMNNFRSNLALPGSILETNMLAEVADYPTNYSIPAISDLWLENASFVRLDNWQLGYNIPATGVLQRARIYVGGNNLFLITEYKGADPELEVKGDLNDKTPNNMGMDYSNVYPKTRSFQLGVNLTF